MSWFLHFCETEDPPKAGDIKAVCGQMQKEVTPVYGEAGEEFRVCPECEVAAQDKSRRFRSYLFPSALLRKKKAEEL